MRAAAAALASLLCWTTTWLLSLCEVSSHEGILIQFRRGGHGVPPLQRCFQTIKGFGPVGFHACCCSGTCEFAVLDHDLAFVFVLRIEIYLETRFPIFPCHSHRLVLSRLANHEAVLRQPLFTRWFTFKRSRALDQ